MNEKVVKQTGDAAPTYRRYVEGETAFRSMTDMIFEADGSYKCPVYVHRAPPCQAHCPSGHDVRGWLSIVSGLDKPTEGTAWQGHAFHRMTEANPFPAIMGRVCPAPCQDGCNRDEVDEHVGINAVEQYIGDWAIEHGLAFPAPPTETGKKVAIVGGGPSGLAAAYFLRRKGHACTIFEEAEALGGMVIFGIPAYRTPRDVVNKEIERIIDMGVEVRLGTRVGTDVTVADLERDYDAVYWGIGAQLGKPLPCPGAEASNCVSGISFLRAFNEGRLKHLTGRVLVVGGGDTAMDVAAVARRLGCSGNLPAKDRPENVILGQTVHDVARVARREGADVWIVYRRPISKAPAARHEIDAVIGEGVEIHDNLAPLEVVRGEDGRATHLRVVPVDWKDGTMVPQEGQEFDIEGALIVGATGQAGDYRGIEEFDNGEGLMAADGLHQSPVRRGHFVGGDAITPHLITSAIGHASIAVDSMDRYLRGEDAPRRPKVDVHHFDLVADLRRHGLQPDDYNHQPSWGTCDGNYAVHNYEDRSSSEVVLHEALFLEHFGHVPMNRRNEPAITPETVVGNFEERFTGFSDEQAVGEAERCMSCGMCLECDNCLIYCPQDAVYRLRKEERTIGRYVDTDYDKCTGCHICMDVCPSGYIRMGLGE